MNEPLVFIDLKTTGSKESEDEIIEFGAARVHEGKVTERFSELANVDGPLPLHVTKRTGITEEDLRGKPLSRTVLGDFMDFIGKGVVVTHDAKLKEKFLAEKTRRQFQNKVIDVLDLARILLPTIESHDLDTLARRFQIPTSAPRRACPEAELIAAVWGHLLTELDGISFAVISEINRLLANTVHPLREIFLEAEKRITAKSYGTKKRVIEDIFRNYSEIIDREDKPGPPARIKPLDTDKVCSLFDTAGLFARTLPGYERRPEQLRMVKAVCEAFNTCTHLMVEAGTGTGKSMAYLVPAIHWASVNREKVIVSTNTKNLQAQLFFKDLPFLQETLDVGFKPALIKGRGNYLCVRKFLYLLRQADRELADDERFAMLPILTWAEMTDTGDIGENMGFFAMPSAGLWAKLSTTGDECLARSCRNFHRCFVRKARGLALAADLVIANHAVVFSEVGIDSPVLPEYRHIIFDEAHNIENVATEHFGVRLNAVEVFRVTNRLFRPRRDKAGTGLLANLLFQVSRAQDKLKEELAETLKDRATEAMNKVTALAGTMQAFFNSFSVLFGSGRIIEEKVRFQREEMKGERWAQVREAKEDAIAALAAFAHCLEQIATSLDKADDAIEDALELQRDIQAQALVIRELMTNIEFVLAAEDENHVYWAEATQRRDLEYEICAAPIDIGSMIAQHFYGKKKAVIFSSATLTVGGRFDFVAGRLGANKIERQRFRALSVGSSFDFNRQALLCIPNFLPDPGDGEGKFEEDLTDLLKDMLVAAQGRALVLFTSYSMLNQVYPEVKSHLENEGILVLGQGKDGTRTALLETFKRDVSSVLLGTQSFWEGIDVVGEALSCLVIAKLPFAVFTDPIIKARCERLEAQGTDSFYGYSVPTAVIKLKQGFGRLIRTKTDRGVVVVTDKRVLTRRYGSQFLRSLPSKHRVFLSKEGLVEAVGAFLNSKA